MHTLPHDHPDRTRPLVGAWYRFPGSATWKEVKSSYGIAKACFNDLGETWTKDVMWEWRE